MLRLWAQVEFEAGRVNLMALRQRARCCHAREACAGYPGASDDETRLSGLPTSARSLPPICEKFAELTATIETIGASLGNIRASLATIGALLGARCTALTTLEDATADA